METAPDRFYLNSGKSTPGVSVAWCDLGPVPEENRSFLLGGEVAMWTDLYCYINDCVRPNGPKGAGHELFNRSVDEAFGRSVGGMIWPRGHLAAGSFWNFRPELPKGEVAARATARQNTLASRRGGLVCPTGCDCTVGQACGAPYIPRPSTTITTTSTTSRPRSTTCEWRADTGLQGSDFHAEAAASKEACCALCIASERCAAADFNGSRCHLKHSFNPVNRSDGSIACVPAFPTLV